VRLAQGEWLDIPVLDLALYVSESENPGNSKGVAAVEVFADHALLANGLCLVDTPGIGSVILHNTAEVRLFVPQIDVALVVLGGDPPISGEELDLVDDVALRVRDLVFVLNKADRLTSTELTEARAFTESVLAKRPPSPVRLLEVSALERLHGRETRDWPLLVQTLGSLASAGGPALVEQAGERGAAIIASRLRRRFAEDCDALVRPIQETERRLEDLRRCAWNAQQSLADLVPLFGAEQQRLAKRFERDRQRFVEEATPRVVALLDAGLETSPSLRGPRLRRHALDQAQDVVERLVREWLESEQPWRNRSSRTPPSASSPTPMLFSRRCAPPERCPPARCLRPSIPRPDSVRAATTILSCSCG
jgi:hypothetical protein